MPPIFKESTLSTDGDATEELFVTGTCYITIWDATGTAFTGTLRLQHQFQDGQGKFSVWRNILNPNITTGDQFQWTSPMDEIVEIEKSGVKIRVLLETAGGGDVMVRIAQAPRS